MHSEMHVSGCVGGCGQLPEVRERATVHMLLPNVADSVP